MNTTLAFGIGAIFMLAGLLMLGTKTELLPRMFQAGKAGPLILGALLMVFAICRYGWEMWDQLEIVWASVAGADSGGMTARPQAEAAPLAKQSSPRHPSPQLRARVTNAGPAAPVSGSEEAPMEVITVAAPVEPAGPDAAPGSNASADDAYDSGLKRAVKHVGRFLHISKKTGK